MTLKAGKVLELQGCRPTTQVTAEVSHTSPQLASSSWFSGGVVFSLFDSAHEFCTCAVMIDGKIAHLASNCPSLQDTVPAVSRTATFIPGLEVDLASAAATWLSPTSCLLSLKSGKLLTVAIRFEGPSERRLQVSHQSLLLVHSVMHGP